MYANNFTPIDEALGQLASGAFFFGMRSCESLTVFVSQKTKRFKIRNVRFFRNNIEITDKRSAILKFIDTVSITFEIQKNKKKNITVSQQRSGKDICPVIIWAEIAQRVLLCRGAENASVNLIQIGTS